ncbi:MAG: hypothetical protein HKN12_01350, partial [Gemmatimonadetes bacterium]|nr:hypothetical protein [Gemmatimonadota bacterium]
IVSWTAERPPVEPPFWGERFATEARKHWAEHGNPSAVRIVERRPGFWAVEVDAPSAGWVTLSESAYPGWMARIDGETAMPEPYLEDFLAVAVPAGPHRVEWEYRPRHGTLWLVIALAGLVAAAGLFAAGRGAGPRNEAT